jgi:hypothetical protein
VRKSSPPSRRVRPGTAGPVFYTAIVAALFGFGVFFDRIAAMASPSQDATAALHAQLERQRASPDVLRVAQWAIASRDHAGLPFYVIDKAGARMFAFDGNGQLRASAPVLLGASRGDGAHAPETPAGRFVADTWRSALGDGLVWVDGVAALTLHPASSAAAPGRAQQRLASETVADRRISDGSLHVGDSFYTEFVGPLRGHGSIAYVLPEATPSRELFAQAPGSAFTRRRS